MSMKVFTAIIAFVQLFFVIAMPEVLVFYSSFTRATRRMRKLNDDFSTPLLIFSRFTRNIDIALNQVLDLLCKFYYYYY